MQCYSNRCRKISYLANSLCFHFRRPVTLINDLIIFSGEAFGNKINCLNFEAQTSAASMMDFGILERYHRWSFQLVDKAMECQVGQKNDNGRIFLWSKNCFESNEPRFKTSWPWWPVESKINLFYLDEFFNFRVMLLYFEPITLFCLSLLLSIDINYAITA